MSKCKLLFTRNILLRNGKKSKLKIIRSDVLVLLESSVQDVFLRWQIRPSSHRTLPDNFGRCSSREGRGCSQWGTSSSNGIHCSLDTLVGKYESWLKHAGRKFKKKMVKLGHIELLNICFRSNQTLKICF